MTIAVFVKNQSDVESLIRWGVEFAAADHAELLIVLPKRTREKQSFDPLSRNDAQGHPLKSSVFELLGDLDQEKIVLKEDVGTGSESSDLDRVAIGVFEVLAPDPATAFAESVSSLKITLLVLPAHQPVRTNRGDKAWSQRLFSQAPCETIVVRGVPPKADSIRVIVATDDENDPNTDVAVRRGRQLLHRFANGSLTLLFVRPDDDVVAERVAQRHLERMARLVPEKKIDLRTTIQLADNLVEGIKQLDLSQYDLVLVGTGKQRLLVQLFRQSDTFDKSITAIAAIRKSVPVGHQLWSRFRELVRRYVPQIERDERITVVDRLQNNSLFNFDFVALMSLSTLIAALGLARDSAAVVIGAMLVAPLMTPLVAIGFSLVQGNQHLIRRAMKSVMLGFTVALGIGIVVGLVLHVFAPELKISKEMHGRGSPNLLDLVVALASGVAGAYAMGRAHLVSAIPGVAIAAALVPPIATSGLSLAMGDFMLSGGSLLLFVTNIVAIVLGTTVAFWAIGINSREHHAKTSGGSRPPILWPRYVFFALVILSFLLAAEMNFYNPLTSP